MSDISDTVNELKKIALKDNVTDSFRARKEFNNYFINCASLIGGFLLADNCFEKLLTGGEPHPATILGMFAGIATVLIGGFYGANTSFKLMKDSKGTIEENDTFYLIGGKISTKETKYERVYGRKIKCINSLKGLKKPKTLDDSIDSNQLLFIDNVVLKSYSDNSHDQLPSSEVVPYKGNFRLKLGKKFRNFSVKFDIKPDIYNAFLKTEGKPSSLLCSYAPWTTNSLVGVYNPEDY